MINFTPSGLIVITGEPGSGKTHASIFSNYGHGPKLSEIAYFHDDNKLPPYPFEEFGSHLAMDSDKIKLFEFGREIDKWLSSLSPRKIKHVVFDTWAKYEEYILNYTVNNGKKFRESEAYIMKHEAKVIGAQNWREAYNREGKIASDIAKKFGCLMIISHITEDSRAGAKTTKMVEVIKSRTWNTAANARLWLVRTNGKIPAVLVKKKFDKSSIVNGRPKTVNFLPDRLTPQDEDNSIWDMINRYWHNPVDGRRLESDELPINDEELAIIRDTWTSQQYEIWKVEKETKDRNETQAELDKDRMVIQKIKELSSMPPPAIKHQIKEEFGRDIALPEIIQVING